MSTMRNTNLRGLGLRKRVLHCFGRRRGKGGRRRSRESNTQILGEQVLLRQAVEMDALQDSSDRRLRNTGSEYADLCLNKDAAKELIGAESAAALPASLTVPEDEHRLTLRAKPLQTASTLRGNSFRANRLERDCARCRSVE